MQHRLHTHAAHAPVAKVLALEARDYKDAPVRRLKLDLKQHVPGGHLFPAVILPLQRVPLPATQTVPCSVHPPTHPPSHQAKHTESKAAEAAAVWRSQQPRHAPLGGPVVEKLLHRHHRLADQVVGERVVVPHLDSHAYTTAHTQKKARPPVRAHSGKHAPHCTHRGGGGGCTTTQTALPPYPPPPTTRVCAGTSKASFRSPPSSRLLGCTMSNRISCGRHDTHSTHMTASSGSDGVFVCV
jgi:hypothetical protein